MRIAIGGIHSEESTFSQHRAAEGFYQIARGDEMVPQYRFEERLGDIVEGVEWVPTVRAFGAASGPVLPEIYDAIEAETRAALEAGLPYDGVYLEMHGAGNVLDRQRMEERYVRMVRDVVGPDAVISLSMDTHGNFSEELASLVDLAACHRHAPHIDNLITRDRAVTNLIGTIKRGEKPLKAWLRVPVLLPGERTSTAVEPGRTVFSALEPSIEKYDVLDANMWVGFAWADEDRNAAAVLVTGYDAEEASMCAEELARGYWEARDDFVIVSDHHGSWDEGMQFVLSGGARPVFVSDSGDNTRAGGSGDVTFALDSAKRSEELTSAGVKILFAGMVDPDAFAAAVEAGEGAVLSRTIGALVDDRHADPVAGEWTVEAFIDGLFGEGLTGAILRDGNVSVIVQRKLAPFVGKADPSSPQFNWEGCIHTDTSGYDVVVVKNGYQFPSQLAAAGSSFIAITPGGTDLDFDRLEFRQVWRPIYPLDREFTADLTPVMMQPHGA